MINFIYDEAKATQAAAKLIKLRGGSITVLELLKLLYLTDREALLRWGRPITGDRYVSMKHGPVLSKTYNLIKREAQGEGAWCVHISEPENRALRLLSDPGEDEFSDREAMLIEEIARKWAGVRAWNLRDFTHTLKEWQDPGESSQPISIEAILQAGNKSWEEIRKIEESAQNLRFMQEAFGCK